MNSVNTFLPRYREVNDIIAKIIKDNWIGYKEQITITEFYNDYSDVKIFEQMILNVVQKYDLQTYSLLFSNIMNTNKKNIDLYTSASEILNKIDITDIYNRKNKWSNEIIDRQLKIANECHQKLYQVNKSLDAIEHREHSSQEIVQLWKKHEHLTKEYKEEKDRLSTLYDQQKDSLDEFSKYSENLFSKIYALSISFLSVLNSYDVVKKQVREEKEDQKPKEREKSQILEDGLYIDMATVGLVHKICNKKQFEDLSENALYAFFNLQDINIRPIIKDGEKIRTYYLISKLYEHLELDYNEKKKWLTAILKSWDIKENTYTSKYKDPISASPGTISYHFVQAIDEIFN